MTDTDPAIKTPPHDLAHRADAYLYDGVVEDEGCVCPAIEDVDDKAHMAIELLSLLDDCGIDAIASDPTEPVAWDTLDLGEDEDVARRALLWYHHLTNELDALRPSSQPSSPMEALVQQLGTPALADLAGPDDAELAEIEALAEDPGLAV